MPFFFLVKIRLDINFAQADLGLHCLLTESVDTVVYVDKQEMPRSDCVDAQADLDLRKLHKNPFCALHIILWVIIRSTLNEYSQHMFF